MASYADIKGNQQQEAAQGAAQQAQGAEVMNFPEYLATMKPSIALGVANKDIVDQAAAKQITNDFARSQWGNGNAGQMAFAEGARVGQMADAQALQNEALAMEMAAGQQGQAGYNDVSEYIDPAQAAYAAADANSTMVGQGMPAVDDRAMDAAAMYRQAAAGPGVVDQQY